MYILFFLVMVLLLAAYRIISYFGLEELAILFKFLNSLWFFFAACYSFYTEKGRSEEDKKITLKILFSLFLAMVSDIVIEVNFVAGFVICLFVMAANFYSYMDLGKMSIKVTVGCVLLSALLIFSEFKLPFLTVGNLAVPISLYAILIGFSTVKGIAGSSVKTPGRKLIAVSSVLSLLSDYLLQFTVPGLGKIREVDGFTLVTVTNTIYYVAQMVKAYSITKPIVKKASRIAE